MARSRISRTVAVIAVVFGVITLAAGGRVLLGANPGYVVFSPLLQFNTAMGIAYIFVGVLAWRGLRVALFGAAVVTVLNLLVLGSTVYAYAPGGPIAAASIQAMAFRAAVWVVLLALLARAPRQRG